MSEIKLGWYRSEKDGYTRDFEVVAIRRNKGGVDVACAWSGDGSFSVSLDCIRKREFLGTELPPRGQWVDFDPAKVTCDQFPIKGKAGDDGMTEWIHGVEIFGYYADSTYPFRGRGRNYKFFQTWEAELTPSPKEEADAMVAELREAGGSDLDNVAEVSEAADGTAIGWTIVQVNSDGSILCRDPRGTRRRFWFAELRSQCSQKEAGRMNEEESRAAFEPSDVEIANLRLQRDEWHDRFVAEQKIRLEQNEFVELYDAAVAKVEIERLKAINADLLAACKEALNQFTPKTADDQWVTMRICKAIKKATGEE